MVSVSSDPASPKKNRRPPFNARTARAKFAVFVATFFGSGLLPVAPGTWGTFAAFTFLWYFAGQSIWFQVAFLVFLFVAGTLASAEVQRMTAYGDHQSIVIDEALGVGITLLGAPADWRIFLAGALLFRLFDIVKWPPVGAIDRWSKDRSESALIGGFGVMADDAVAGVQAFVVLNAFFYFRHLLAM